MLRIPYSNFRLEVIVSECATLFDVFLHVGVAVAMLLRCPVVVFCCFSFIRDYHPTAKKQGTSGALWTVQAAS